MVELIIVIVVAVNVKCQIIAFVSVVLLRSKQLIKDAINENDFLKNLESAQVREIVDCMYPKSYNKNDMIVQEGDIGHALYVIAGRTKRWTCQFRSNSVKIRHFRSRKSDSKFFPIDPKQDFRGAKYVKAKFLKFFASFPQTKRKCSQPNYFSRGQNSLA